MRLLPKPVASENEKHFFPKEVFSAAETPFRPDKNDTRDASELAPLAAAGLTFASGFPSISLSHKND